MFCFCCTTSIFFCVVIGVIHKGCLHKFGNFWTSCPPCPYLSTFGWPPPPPDPCGDTRLRLFERLQLVNNSHWTLKKLIILILDVDICAFLLDNFDNSIPKNGVDHEVNVTPGIDSWVQPRLNLGFSWVQNPANPGEPSEQVTQISWVQEPSLPSLAGFIKTNKKPGFSWVCWVCCQSNKIHRAGFAGF